MNVIFSIYVLIGALVAYLFHKFGEITDPRLNDKRVRNLFYVIITLFWLPLVVTSLRVRMRTTKEDEN